MFSLISIALTAALGFQQVAAQTYSSCNPTEKTGCDPDPALGTTINFDFTDSSSNWTDYFEVTGKGNGAVSSGTSTGLELTMNEKGDAPTINSDFYIFFGKVEVTLRASNGTGIVSSFVLESDDLDEIDWEWFGTDITQTESNYFGKGNTTTYDRAGWHDMANPIADYHTYTVDWNSDRIIWSIDGTAVRTLLYADAVDGKNFPQTPMVIKVGIWAGGDSDNAEGTIEWAGGETDYSTAPFTMYVKSLYIEDYSSGKSYVYGDETGSWQSIEISQNTTTKKSAVVNSGSSNSSVVGGINSTSLYNFDNTTDGKFNSSVSQTTSSGVKAVSFSGFTVAAMLYAGFSLL